MTTIESLPNHLCVVPSERKAWLRWRTLVLEERELVHKECDADFTERAVQIRLCADDPAYFMVMFGVLYEPRPTVDIVLAGDGAENSVDRPPGWYPWVPFAFQVDMVRWFQKIVSKTYDPLGRGDGVIEKSREMGASWVFCLLAAHGWLFLDDQTIMLMSKSAELVDNRGDPGSLFYKIRALVGIYDKVPRASFAPGTIWDGLRARLPEWMTPPIVAREHDHVMKLMHPTKNNTVIGETTTSTSGTGGRATWLGIDEAAKNPKLKDINGGLASVSYHRLLFSSASLEFGSDFYDLARTAEAACTTGGPGPSYMRINWELHPLRTDEWFASERARSTDPYDFEREYGLNYHAGYGDFYYPYAKQMLRSNAPYSTGIGQVTVSIDPGLGDPTAMNWWQKDAGTGRHRLFESLQIHTESARFIVPILMGFPEDHEIVEQYYNHKDAIDILDVMATTWDLRQRKEAVRFVGDSFGNNSGGNDKVTFYDECLRVSRELSEKYPLSDEHPVHIVVHSKTKDGARGFFQRRKALTSLLKIVDVNDTPRCGRTLEAWREIRFAKGTTINDRLRPERGWWSHLVAASEYYGLHVTMREEVEKIVANQNRTRSPSLRERRQRVA